MLRATLLALLVSTPALANADTWQRRSVPGHDVSVELPGPSEHKRRERSVVVATVVSDTLVTRDEHGWCAATVTKAPRFALGLAGADKVLTRARDSLVDDYQGRVLSWTPVQRDGHRGMRVTFTTERDPARPEQGVAEFFTYDGKVVTLAALRTRGAPDEVVERVFASVDLGG